MDNYSVSIGRPEAGESAAYYHGYIGQVEGSDALSVLKEQKQTTLLLLGSIPDDKWDHRYAPNKWSVKELLLHVIDAERIFAYRALRLARNDQTALPGFDQDLYVPESGADQRSPASIIGEYQSVREATISLFENMPVECHLRMAQVSGGPMSCRALCWIIVGHEKHHCRILGERYL